MSEFSPAGAEARGVRHGAVRGFAGGNAYGAGERLEVSVPVQGAHAAGAG